MNTIIISGSHIALSILNNIILKGYSDSHYSISHFTYDTAQKGWIGHLANQAGTNAALLLTEETISSEWHLSLCEENTDRILRFERSIDGFLLDNYLPAEMNREHEAHLIRTFIPLIMKRINQKSARRKFH